MPIGHQMLMGLKQLVTNVIAGISGSLTSTSFVPCTAETTITADGSSVGLLVSSVLHVVPFGGNGSCNAEVKLQRKTGVSTWTDIGAAVASSAGEAVDTETGSVEVIDGGFDFSRTDTPSAGSQTYRLVGRKASGNHSGSVTGTLTITP